MLVLLNCFSRGTAGAHFLQQHWQRGTIPYGGSRCCMRGERGNAACVVLTSLCCDCFHTKGLFDESNALQVWGGGVICLLSLVLIPSPGSSSLRTYHVRVLGSLWSSERLAHVLPASESHDKKDQQRGTLASPALSGNVIGNLHFDLSHVAMLLVKRKRRCKRLSCGSGCCSPAPPAGFLHTPRIATLHSGSPGRRLGARLQV